MAGGCLDTLQLAGAMLADRFGIGARMQFDHRRTDSHRGFQLRRFGIDEQRDADSRFPQLRARFLQRLLLADDVQAAFGGHFSALFRHQATVRRTHLQRDAHHLLGGRHFQVQPRLQRVLAHPHIAILDMPAVFAQMNGDAIRARLFGDERSK